MSHARVSHATLSYELRRKYMALTYIPHRHGMLYVIRVNESCHTHTWDLSESRHIGIRMCHVTHIHITCIEYNLWYTCEWVMSHTWVRSEWVTSHGYTNEIRHAYMSHIHVTHRYMNELCHIYMSHTKMPHTYISHTYIPHTHRHEICDTYEWVMSHIWVSHVTHMNESCHTYEWVMSHIWMSHVTHMNESCHTYEWVMSHIWMSHVTHMSEIWVSHIT